MFRWPKRETWLQTALIFFVFAIVSLSFGFATGLFKYQQIDDSYALIRAGVIALIIPSLFEELLFRGPLIILKTRVSARTLLAAALVSLALFILWHPLNAAFILTEAQYLFIDWRFLVTAFLLGAATTIAALKTGSIWPCVAIHWAAVISWKAFLGGPDFF